MTERVCPECAKGIHIYCEDDASAEPCACRCSDGTGPVTDGPILTAKDEANARWQMKVAGAA